MKTLKTYTTFLLLAISPFVAKAQNTVGYTYDAAGNRIKRLIVLTMQQTPQDSTQQEQVKRSYNDRISKTHVRIYPNPTQGALKVEVLGLEGTDNCLLRIFNANGQQITSTRTTSAVSTLDLSSQPNGVYFLRISIGDNESTWKIIKK